MDKGVGAMWQEMLASKGVGKVVGYDGSNYLRPDLKRGAFSPQEEELIIHFHSFLGNRFITLL